jgi:hypothetical protein
MELTQEMRKSLQRNLPQGTLDYLNEKFKHLEECLHKIKALEEQAVQKDDMIYRMMQGRPSAGQSGGLGFHQSRLGGYEPWYREQYGQQGSEFLGPQNRRGRYPSRGENEYDFYNVYGRRGVDRKNFEATPDSRYRQYSDNHEIERPKRRYMPQEQPGIVPLYRDETSDANQPSSEEGSGGSDGGQQ